MLLAALAAAPGGAQPPTYPRYGLFNTEIRFLHSEHVGRLFKVFVNLPRQYQQEPERRYPALYVLDPAAHFGMFTDIQRLLEDGRRLEPVLTVGIGYESIVLDTLSRYRTIDMLPTPNPNGLGGGAPLFLRFVEEELIPYIQSQYRVDPARRALWGGSYGGLFGAYVLLERPELFTGYMLNSPVLAHDNGLLFRYEEELATARRDLPARVYMAAGGLEPAEWMLEPLREMERRLRSRRYPGLELQVDVVEGEDHFTVAPTGITRGLGGDQRRPPAGRCIARWAGSTRDPMHLFGRQE
ncbi:MAG: alpha/beta hydrolase-fold protein [Candidatus Latescibacterota bacterium]